jgi:hypothetical protein
MGAKRLRILVAGLAAALVLAGGLVCAFIVLKDKPAPLWLVEEGLAEQWEAVLGSAPESPGFTALEIYRGNLPKNRYGYIITTALPPKEAGETGMVRVYPNLAETRRQGDALVLALDPWLVFSEFTDPALSRSRVEEGGDRSGLLAAPGGDSRARFAWLSQLLQNEPGVFPPGEEYWETQGNTLFHGGFFQHGAATYNWDNTWELFLREKPAWIYAPLSSARSLLSYQSAGLVAARFPENRQWNRYGIQAEILWAIPFGGEQYTAFLEAAETWLESGAVQTLIANTLKWIPSVPGGRPYNTLSRSAQLAWLNSSFVWQPSKR